MKLFKHKCRCPVHNCPNLTKNDWCDYCTNEANRQFTIGQVEMNRI